MNADLEAAIAEGRRRMKAFEEKTAHQLEMFDREVDNNHHKLGHKYAGINEDLKPVSWPLWGVVLETSSGQHIYKDHVSFDLVAKQPRKCVCTSSLNDYRPQEEGASDYYRPLEEGSAVPSIEAQAIIEGRKWGVNKYLYDDEYVSNPPYGLVMRRSQFEVASANSRPPPEAAPSSAPDPELRQMNTKLVSKYWRKKWKIPDNW